MSITTQTTELLALARNITDTVSRDGLTKRDNLRELLSSLKNATRSVTVAHNELSLTSKLPPETVAAISEFVAEPGTRESMFEIVKLTHVCQYWRSTLISCPHLWSSIFAKNGHRDFVAACLERSRKVPLTVRLDLEYGDYLDFSEYTYNSNKRTAGMRIDEDNPCRYHTYTVTHPLVEDDCIQRIRKLDFHFTMPYSVKKENLDEYFGDPLYPSGIIILPLPILESFSFRVHYEFDVDTHMELPRKLFYWRSSPPTKLRHLTLHGCYGGPIHAVSNLTSLELSGDPDVYNPIELGQHTFLPLISSSPFLISLHLSHCSFPDRIRLSRVIPVKLSELKSLQLINIDGLPVFSRFAEVPAFKTLSALWISAGKLESHAAGFHRVVNFLVRAESDDGFQLFYDAPNDEGVVSYWLGVTYGADPSPAIVRFEGELDPTRKNEMKVSPLPLFTNAKILEISASFASPWYRNFWEDLGKVGSQLTTLRLEVTGGMTPAVVKSVKEFAKVRLKKGMPLAKLERMTSEGTSKEDEEKAKKLWKRFRAGLNIDQYLIAQ